MQLFTWTFQKKQLQTLPADDRTGLTQFPSAKIRFPLFPPFLFFAGTLIRGGLSPFSTIFFFFCHLFSPSVFPSNDSVRRKGRERTSPLLTKLLSIKVGFFFCFSAASFSSFDNVASLIKSVSFDAPHSLNVHRKLLRDYESLLIKHIPSI